MQIKDVAPKFQVGLLAYLSIAVGIVMLLCFFAFGSHVVRHQIEAARNEMRADTERVAVNLDAATTSDILERRWDNLELIVLHQVDLGKLREIVVTDAEGRVLTRVLREAGGRGRVSYTQLAAIPPQSGTTIDLLKEEIVVHRTLKRGPTIGGLRIRASLSELAAARREIISDTIVTALIATICAILLIGLVVSRITRDLRRAAEFATRLEDLQGAQLSVDGPVRETNAIIAELNRVSGRLATQNSALADSEARKTAILEAGLDCFITIDEAGHIVDFNHAAERCFGYMAEEVRGHTMSEIIVPPNFRDAHERGMAHYRQTGDGPALRRRIEITAMRRSGEIFPVELAIVPFGTEGRRYFAGFIRDITERKTLEAEQARVSGLLNESLREISFQKLALDEHAIVSITDSSGAITYANDKFSQISGYSKEELQGNTHRIVKSGMHSKAFYSEMWDTISAGRVWHGQIANRAKDGSIYWVASTIVPWLDDNRLPYQFVSIRTDITAQKRIEQDLEEARARELETGSQIQRSLLLADMPKDLHGATLATFTEPSQGVDGDFFAVTRFRPDCFEVLVGDVMGKGIPAALIGAGVKNCYSKALAEIATQRSDGSLPAPADIVNHMHSDLTPRLIALESFVTLALYRFDGGNQTITYVNAGHTPGLLARKGGQVKTIEGNNLPIGVMDDEVYCETVICTEDDDTLLLYSDGVSEAVNPAHQEFGAARLAGILSEGHGAELPPNVILEAIRQNLREFLEGTPQADDQTVILVELHPRRSGTRAKLGDRKVPEVFVLPWSLTALGHLRERIAAVGTGLGAAIIDSMILASFEAATNILRHSELAFSGAALTVRLSRSHEALVVQLFHPGKPFTPPAEPSPDFSGNSDGGFGLFIISQCVDHVDYIGVMPGISCVRLEKRIAAV